MFTPIIGILFLISVIIVALSERTEGQIGFLDWHAAIVVFGGVIGSLMIAIDSASLRRMIVSLRELLPSASIFKHEMAQTAEGLKTMREAWRGGQRAIILDMADNAPTEELKAAADALIRGMNSSALAERFTELRAGYMHRIVPVMEGWDLVGRLAPSFGMVGTVTGMVQLFRNMAEHSGNLGGAMAMALVATLYGIALGATVGGPMASRVNKQLNDRLAFLELMEKTVASLIEETRGRRGADA